jgi:hypothetical protein
MVTFVGLKMKFDVFEKQLRKISSFLDGYTFLIKKRHY